MQRDQKKFKDDFDFLKCKWQEPCFDPATGLDKAAYAAELRKIVASFKAKETWMMIKARMFKLGCEKVGIDVSPHDWYPTIASWHRHRQPPISGILQNRSNELDKLECPEVRKSIDQGNSDGTWNMWKDFDHSIPWWDDVLKLGFPGLKKRLLAYWKDDDFYRSRLIAADALLTQLDRLVAQGKKRLCDATELQRARMEKQIAALENLREREPRTAYEVLLFIYIYWVDCELFDAFQVRSLSNIDRLLTPYYRADIKAGRTTEDEFIEQLKYFWWQWGSIDNYWGQPVFLGGTKPDGSSEYNEVSKIILDIHDELALPTPKVQLKMSLKSTPDWVWKKTLDMARRHSSIVFCGEEPMGRALKCMVADCTDEDIRTLTVGGCYEFALKDGYNSTAIAHVNLLKPIERMLADAKNGKFLAATFAEFKGEYLKRLAAVTTKCMALAYEWEKTIGKINPSNVFTLATEYAVKNGKDAFVDGTERGNASMILQTGLGTAVDALLAVEEIVYGPKREMTLAELGKVMAANWRGHEALRLRMLRSKHKWGNNFPAANRLADEIVKCYGGAINGKPNSKNGRFFASGHCAKQFIVLAQKTGATPDGRRKGEEMSKNISPTMGADTEGVTALLNSVANIDACDLPADFPLDVMLLPYTVAGDEGLDAMRVIVEQYFVNGGCAIHFNVFDVEQLRDAQKNPSKYANLQVRVCGWNVRWNDLPRVEQEAYIRRAEEIGR